MALEHPYKQRHYLGEYANDAGALTFIQANEWDHLNNGTGNPRDGMIYYNTTTKQLCLYANSAWVAIQTGTTDHGALGGLGDDDHTHYTLADGTRAFTGNQDMGSNKLTGLGNGTDATDAVNLGQLESLVNGIEHQDSVLDKDLTAPPGGETLGDRYIVGGSATGAWATHDNKIAEWNGASYDFTTPTEGFSCWVDDENRYYHFNGTIWTKGATVVDHNDLNGLQGGTGGEYYHLTSTQHTDLTGGGENTGHIHDTRYYRENEHVNSSAGAGDAGKPVVLDAAGHIDATMLNSADIDHGSLTGNGDDDHSQYHNDTRGDARYHTQTELNSTTATTEGAKLIGTDAKTNLGSAVEVEAALTFIDGQNPVKFQTGAGTPNNGAGTAGAIGDRYFDTTNSIEYVNSDGNATGWQVS